MGQIAIMLKKFKNINHFFHPDNNHISTDFSPFVTTIGGERLQVMQATDNNNSDLLDLEREVYKGEMPWSSFSFKTELQKTKNSLYVVVYQASTLVGFIGARFLTREAHITNIAVSPVFQGRGIWTFLLNLMIQKARDNKCECISLEVRIDNDRAKKLYSDLGFEATFIRKNYYQDDVDAVNMVCWLMPHKLKERS